MAAVRRVAHAVEILAHAMTGAVLRARRLGAIAAAAAATARARAVLAEPRARAPVGAREREAVLALATGLTHT